MRQPAVQTLIVLWQFEFVRWAVDHMLLGYRWNCYTNAAINYRFVHQQVDKVERFVLLH
jgi:hypothetical protein